MIDLDATEQAQMFLSHAGSEAEALAPQVHDMAGLWITMKATQDKLNGRVPSTDVVRIYVSPHTESELARVIYDLELRKSVEEPLTPGELYMQFIKALEDHIEDMMVDIHGVFLDGLNHGRLQEILQDIGHAAPLLTPIRHDTEQTVHHTDAAEARSTRLRRRNPRAGVP